MNPPSGNSDQTAGEDARYSLEIVAKITGIASQTILHYQEQGLVSTPDDDGFDDESVYALRRIEHVRETFETNPAALRLILELIGQVEELRATLRRR
jgi:DNA-binding transcriptional MerR regulator